MKTKMTLGLLLLSAIIPALCGFATGQDVIVVVNKQTSISQITISQLREIFTGTRSRFTDGGRALPVLLKGGPVHEVFLHHYLGESPAEFRTRWRKAVFTGEGSMPKEFGTEAAILEYVAATPGAIGYVSRISDPDAVKTLMVSAEP